MGKYNKGLEQDAMAFCGDREDIVSAFLSATSGLLRKYNIDPSQIGRLECGTETLIDKSKAVKTQLMQLFEKSGNHDVEVRPFACPLCCVCVCVCVYVCLTGVRLQGVDNLNACYGGTAALLNTLAWMQSPGWDGRYGLVVMGDIAVYEPGPARPTGGVGVTALLIGPDAPIVIDPFRASHFENVYDFYKPNLSSEYPAVDGHLSISCYYRSLDGCYEGYRRRFKTAMRRDFNLVEDAPYALFHSPFTKLVRKSYARLFQNDFLLRDKKEGLSAKAKLDKDWRKLSLEDTYTHTDIQKEFSNATEDIYEQRVMPSLLLSKQLGNSYTGSLYASLASLIATQTDQQLHHKRALLFSYGSGSAATMFSATFAKSVANIRQKLDIQNRLEHRRSVTAEEYLETMKLRERTHSLGDYTPEQSVEDLFPGTFYLKHVDKKKRRTYEQKKFD